LHSVLTKGSEIDPHPKTIVAPRRIKSIYQATIRVNHAYKNRSQEGIIIDDKFRICTNWPIYMVVSIMVHGLVLRPMKGNRFTINSQNYHCSQNEKSCQVAENIMKLALLVRYHGCYNHKFCNLL
jgi:hypothetical protein